jgi:hypothetical protein
MQNTITTEQEKSYEIIKIVGWKYTYDIIDGSQLTDSNDNVVYNVPHIETVLWLEFLEMTGNLTDVDHLEYFTPNLYKIENIELFWKVVNWTALNIIDLSTVMSIIKSEIEKSNGDLFLLDLVEFVRLFLDTMLVVYGISI